MLKKSVQDFFNHDLAGLPPSKFHKLQDFSILAIAQSIYRSGLWLVRKITFIWLALSLREPASIQSQSIRGLPIRLRLEAT